MSTCHRCSAELAPGMAFCGVCGARQAGQAAAGIFHYVPHPHIEGRKKKAPKSTHPQAGTMGPLARFNAALAVRITGAVGTMWCAYVFALLALVSLPDAVRGGTPTLIAWIAQTFLQLVLLSIIMVGQKVQGVASDNRAIDTYKDAEALLAEVVEIQKHLLAQDAWLQQLITAYQGQVPPPPEPPGK